MTNGIHNDKHEESSNQERPRLSGYFDYRLYLRDMYEFRRQASEGTQTPYTYGVFSAAADLRSPNYLKLVIDGKRNLSDAMIPRFAKALQLAKVHWEEFRFLVLLSQAKNPLERQEYLYALHQIRLKTQFQSGELSSALWEQLASWVPWLIYHLVQDAPVARDEMGELLKGRVKESDIGKTLENLVDLDLVQIDRGFVRRGRALVENSLAIPSTLIRELQAQLTYIGLESLYQDSPQEREFGTLTLSLTESEFEELRFVLRKMRKQIHKDNAVARSQTAGGRIYQLNFQLFPMTHRRKVMKSQGVDRIVDNSVDSEDYSQQ